MSRNRGLARRRRLRLVRGERGAATVETVLAMPVILLAILTIAQASLWLYAAHAAQTVATQALDATRVSGGSEQAGRHRATRLIDQVGHGSLHHPQVTVSRGPATATVSVEATAPAVLPGLHLTVRSRAAGPVERYVPGGRP